MFTVKVNNQNWNVTTEYHRVVLVNGHNGYVPMGAQVLGHKMVTRKFSGKYLNADMQ